MTSTFNSALAVAFALFMVSGLVFAQVSGDTLQLPPPSNTEAALVGSSTDETNDALLNALNPVPDLTGPLTHGGTDQAYKQGAEFYKRQSELSRVEARRLFTGKGKGPRVNAYRDDMAKRGNFLKKLGVVMTIVEWWGTACQVGGRLCEGDGVGAVTVVMDKGLETGAGLAGGAAGGTLGPVGAVAGSAAAVEGYKAYVSPELKQWEQDQEYEARKATHLGTRRPKRIFSGTWNTEEAFGTITLTKQGQEVRAVIAGTYGNSRVSGSGGGKVADDGSFSFTLTGAVVSQSDGKVQRYPYSGSISGTATDSGGSGRLSGANQHGSESGTWSAGG